MKAFVSGQWYEQGGIKHARTVLEAAGHTIIHDWTQAKSMTAVNLDQRAEAGRRAKLDIDAVIASEFFVLVSDNLDPGKGMYAELGAAIALYQITGKPKPYVIGALNHISIFYLHPDVTILPDIEAVIADLHEL